MQKVRVFQLAKELRVQSALILELLDRMGREVKSDLSTLDGGTADQVRQKVTLAIEAEKKRMAEERLLEAEQAREEREEHKDDERELAAQADEKGEADRKEETGPAATPVAVADTPAAPANEQLPVAASPASPPAPAVAAPTAAVLPTARVAPSIPGAPVGRTPRVFPARRIPPPSMFQRKPVGAVPGQGARAGEPVARPGMPPMGRPAPGAARGAPPMVPKRRRKRKQRQERQVALAPARPKELPPVPERIALSESVTVKELAEKLNRKSKDVIAKLIPRGVLATINQPLDPKTAIAVAQEFGSTATILTFEEEAQRARETGEPAKDAAVEEPAGTEPRPPVVTVMGHVDHGKTSLLDAIRATDVVSREAGGITQHIGAYQVVSNGRKITFLDTPGHEAFTLMRARGARATDIVVLVIAADDGVKPQTLEAIDHARAANAPILVAINKIDKPNANTDRVKQQLAENDLIIEEYGGSVVACEVSAKQQTGLEHLLEMILLSAEIQELKADPKRLASGVVLEARRDRARGVLATVLVQNGTLKAGDAFIAGSAHGKVRAMVDEDGKRVAEAGPSTPVEVMGYANEPSAGDSFQAVSDENKARQIASFRKEKARAERQRKSAHRTLETLAAEAGSSGLKELSLVLKADVSGSLEALEKALQGLPSDKVRVTTVRSSIGAISQADVILAAASNSIVVGFNVRPDKPATALASREKVQLRMYSVIYELLEDIEKAMVGLLEPTYREVVQGQAEVRQLFKVPKIGVIAGCYVTDGKIPRKAEARLLRDNVVVHTGKLGSLRRFKDDASEVKQGFECGIGLAKYNDLKEGDVIECFIIEEIAAKSL